MNKKVYWSIIAFLFSPLLLGVVFSFAAMLFGCQNWFEVGCAQGIGNTFAFVGFVGLAASLVTIPIAFLVGIIWLVSGMTVGTMRIVAEKNSVQKRARSKAMVEAFGYLIIIALILLGIPWLVNHAADFFR